MRTVLLIILLGWVINLQAQVAGDFRSAISGSWTSPSTWERYSSTGVWQASGVGENNPGLIPTSVNDVTIQANHSVALPTSGARNCKNLTVNSNGKLFCNNSNVNNSYYLDVYGDIICNGQIGNGNTYDAICFNIEGVNCSISGTGLFDASRIRKGTNTNVTTNLTITRNINLHYGSTVLFNNANNSTFNVTVNLNDTIFIVGDGTYGGCVCINGPYGTGTVRSGTFTINGAIKIFGGYAYAGVLYLTSSSSGVCTFTIGATGYVETPTLDCSSSGSGGHTFNVNGYLKITEEPSTFSTPSTSKNTYNIATASTIEYSRAGNQTIYNFGTNSYGNLIVSGSGVKTLNGNTTIANQLNVINGSITTGTNNFSLGTTASAIFYPTTFINISGGTTNFNNRPVSFQSNSNGTAFISTVRGILQNATKITMQRWISAQRGYRALAHPFNEAMALSSIQDFVITGLGEGFDHSGGASVFYYDSVAANNAIKELTHSYTASHTVWSANRGLFFFIRGSGNEGMGFNYTNNNGQPTAFAMSISGTVNKGILADYILGYKPDGNNYSLVGNPYPAPVNIKLLQSNNGALYANGNVEQSIYVFNPSKSAGSKTMARGGYDCFINDGNTDIMIPVMGCFLVRAISAAQVIKWDESVKYAGNELNIFGNNDRALYKMKLVAENDEGYWDDVQIRWAKGYNSAGTDRADAKKLPNALLDFYSIAADDQKLCIDSRNIDSLANDTISFGFEYKMSAIRFNIRLDEHTIPDEYEILWKDAATNQTIPLRILNASVSLSADTNCNSKRYQLILKKKTVNLAALDSMETGHLATISPATAHNYLLLSTDKKITKNQPAEIRIIDLSGRTVLTETLKENTFYHTINISGLVNGYYFLELKNAYYRETFKFLKQ
ncbi:MAG: T9SS type A sorting domain-containing protein [Sphingobacteriia bacterium]|nr:T9SS type A sorting domain-containing protein [Sphingobacteriia bacterium]